MSGHGSQVLRPRTAGERLRGVLCVIHVEHPTRYTRLRHGFPPFSSHVLDPYHVSDRFGSDQAVFCHTTLSQVDSHACGNVHPLFWKEKGVGKKHSGIIGVRLCVYVFAFLKRAHP